MKRIIILSVILTVTATCLHAQNRSGNALRETDPAYFKSPEATRIGDQVLLYQRVTGGWPKNIDMARRLTDEEWEDVLSDKHRRDDSTTDNNATSLQMDYLARLYQATGERRFADGFRRGVDYLLSGQYANGGWPQFWPEMHGYQIHITYNDDAMIHTMTLLRDIAAQTAPYQGKLTTPEQRKRAAAAFDKGIECILNTQIVVDGVPTVWCQQHNRETLAPAPARAFELASFCSMESASIIKLLMELPHPDDRVKRAIHGAMKWFDTHKLTGLRVQRTGLWRHPESEVALVKDEQAPPLWGRYYDLEHGEPFVCDRDGLPRRRIEDIGRERRNSYAWYSERPNELYGLYDHWVNRHDPHHRVALKPNGKGINETGQFDFNAVPKKNLNDFDVIVNSGESIQQVIEQAPMQPDKPYKIFIRKGTYQQKVIIDRPNIVLVGENRDSTILVLAETAETRTIKEYHGREVGNGVVVLQEGADDCVISGLTIYNNYGTTVENTTKHQMAVFGRATRTIIINSNIWADGNDALSLWAREGNGMYYHADLFLRCPGVDFLCPRGWCYATRCRFYGDGRAILWHDGRGDPSKKLVVANSTFDAKSPTILGRYHHDSQFYVVNCKLSKQILDTNISYAYTDKVLDPCPWGQRTYYNSCVREGGHGDWLNDNLHDAPGHPVYHEITAQWTFDGKWDPEQRLRDLWYVLAY